MKYLSLIVFCCLTATLLSCEDDPKVREAEVLRAQNFNDSILKIISSNWKFNVPAPAPKVQQRIANWNEWQQFLDELEQKPKNSIDAYKAKTKDLADKVDLLNNNIPPTFDKPQVKSRIGVLTTKIKSLYTYTNLDIAQDKKVVALINEISREIASIQNQFDEIIRFSEIPKEMGEAEMLRALDTTRHANPESQAAPTPQRLEPKAPEPNILRRKRTEQLRPRE